MPERVMPERVMPQRVKSAGRMPEPKAVVALEPVVALKLPC